MTANLQPQTTQDNDLYARDIVAWAERQAHLLRAGRLGELDVAHLAEEIEDVGKSERRELASRMSALLTRLLKWQHQPDRRGSSWEATIRDQRHRIGRRLVRAPSLKTCLTDPDWWLDAWGDARTEAAREIGAGFEAFPTMCPWTAAEILDPEFWPDGR